jgi:hypothetical protein
LNATTPQGERRLVLRGVELSEMCGAGNGIAPPRQEEPPAGSVDRGQESLEHVRADDRPQLDAEHLRDGTGRERTFVDCNGDVAELDRPQLQVRDPVANGVPAQGRELALRGDRLDAECRRRLRRDVNE